MKAVLYMKLKMFKTLLLRVSFLARSGAKVGRQKEVSLHFFLSTYFVLVFCPYDENQMKVTDKECLCSEQESLTCKQGETCVRPRPSGTGGDIKDGASGFGDIGGSESNSETGSGSGSGDGSGIGSGSGDGSGSGSGSGDGSGSGGVSGSTAECRVACLNPARGGTNNIESPGHEDQEYLMGEHTFTCTDNHYVMTQKVLANICKTRTYHTIIFSPMKKASPPRVYHLTVGTPRHSVLSTLATHLKHNLTHWFRLRRL